MAEKQKTKWKRWQKVTVIVATVLLVVGVGFLLFPVVSNFFGQQHANSVIDTFHDSKQHIVPESSDEIPDDPAVAAITSKSYRDALENGEVDEDGYAIDASGARTTDYPVVFQYDLNALRRDSLAYNKSLIDHQGTVDTSDYASAALRMSDYGLSNFYCYLSAPSISLNLPVYLGANDAMMASGAAHLSGTSLPVDQKDTNVAIAGHTGYIGRIFFDNIRRLEIGDTVTIDNYWETIDYRVIDHKIVSENSTGDIYIQEGRQLLTLITCIYAGNHKFDRYLVICEKV